MNGRVLTVISAGGALGALARYGLGVAWPPQPAGFPWTTWSINVSGCLLIGLLYTWIPRFRPRQRLLRPFLGVGFLGGYTTFSTSMLDTIEAPTGTGLAYLVATLLGALLAVAAGAAIAERLPR